MELEKDRVEIYREEEEILNYSTEVSLYNIYVMGEEYLDSTFHEVEYHFTEVDEHIISDLEEFRESGLFSWYGEKIIPLVSDFRGYPSMSLHIPNSLVHDEVSEKNKAANFAETVTEELESFLSE
jgi:hypothetical protein